MEKGQKDIINKVKNMDQRFILEIMEKGGLLNLRMEKLSPKQNTKIKKNNKKPNNSNDRLNQFNNNNNNNNRLKEFKLLKT